MFKYNYNYNYNNLCVASDKPSNKKYDTDIKDNTKNDEIYIIKSRYKGKRQWLE